MTHKKYISPYLWKTCRYHPSCSEYAVQALEKHGALRGSILAVMRILRCNQYFRGGFDPVR